MIGLREEVTLEQVAAVIVEAAHAMAVCVAAASA
jgi:hypothetical protein